MTCRLEASEVAMASATVLVIASVNSFSCNMQGLVCHQPIKSDAVRVVKSTVALKRVQ